MFGRLEVDKLDSAGRYGSDVAPAGANAARWRARPARRLLNAQNVRSRRAWPVWIRLSLLAYLIVNIGRIHEVFPPLAAVPIGDLVALSLIAALVLAGRYRRLPGVVRTQGARLTIAFLAIGALSIPFALWPGGAFGTFNGMLKSWLLCFMLPLAVTTPEQLRTVLRIFALSAGLLLLAYVGGVPGVADPRALSFDRNEVAMFAVMGVPFSIAWGAERGRWRWIGTGLSILLVTGVIVTGSRGGFLALAAVGLAFLLRSRVLNLRKKLVILVVAAALVTAVGSGEYWSKISAIFTDPTEDYNFQEREGRIEIWKRGLSYATAHPVTGVGIGNFPVAEGYTLEDVGHGVKWSAAHSAYVLVFAELGYPGILVFLLIIVGLARTASGSGVGRVGRPGPASVSSARILERQADAFALALLGYLVSAIFLSVAYGAGPAFMIGTAITMSMLRGAEMRRAPRPLPVGRVRRAGAPST